MRYIQPGPVLCTVFAVFASCASTASSAAPAPLILNEIHQTGGQGKPLDLRVEEVSRDTKTSTVEIRFVSGASVPSSMFIMHAIYDIARARGDRYFVKLSEYVEDAGKRTMLIGFSREKVVDVGSYYDTAHIQYLDGKLEQLDTDMFDLVFKKQELPKDK